VDNSPDATETIGRRAEQLESSRTGVPHEARALEGFGGGPVGRPQGLFALWLVFRVLTSLPPPCGIPADVRHLAVGWWV